MQAKIVNYSGPDVFEAARGCAYVDLVPVDRGHQDQLVTLLVTHRAMRVTSHLPGSTYCM